MLSRIKATLGYWRSGVRWMGSLGRPEGIARPSGRAQAFDLDDSRRRHVQDLGDMKSLEAP